MYSVYYTLNHILNGFLVHACSNLIHHTTSLVIHSLLCMLSFLIGTIPGFQMARKYVGYTIYKRRFKC